MDKKDIGESLKLPKDLPLEAVEIAICQSLSKEFMKNAMNYLLERVKQKLRGIKNLVKL